MTRELERAARPADPTGVMDLLERRRSRRVSVRKVQAGALAFAVIAATTGGFLVLRQAFGDGERRIGGDPAPTAANGEIVFSAGSPDGYVHLYAIQPDGSGRRQVTDYGTDDTAPAVSPDGRTVAFVHQLEDAPPAIATVQIDGGIVTWLTDPDLFVTDGPSWSPDGTRIAFAAHDGEGQRVLVMNANGSDVHPITGDDVHWAEGPAWSPDGTTIAFAASPISGDEEPSVWDIYTIGADGSDLVNVTDSPVVTSDESSPTWSPDGERLAFSRSTTEASRIVIRSLADGAESGITSGSFVDGSPAWSPDGRWIAFDRAGFERGPGEHPAQEDVWLIRPDGTDARRLTTERGSDPTWQQTPLDGGTPGPTSSPEPSPPPSPADRGTDPLEIGLNFRLCNWSRLSGVDLLGDGARGIAWVGTKAAPNGTCPNNYDDRYGVAADVNGDGIADSWSGETIAYCLSCEPFKAVDLNGDGGEDLIVTVTGFSIMQYGLYTVMPVDGDLQVVPFRTGEPGHADHGLEVGRPFTFWVGGDEGSSDWFYCETIPELRLTGTFSPVDGGPDAETTVHETHVSLGTDGIAHILDAQTYTVTGEVDLQYATSKPDCGLGVDIRRLQAA